MAHQKKRHHIYQTGKIFRQRRPFQVAPLRHPRNPLCRSNLNLDLFLPEAEVSGCGYRRARGTLWAVNQEESGAHVDEILPRIATRQLCALHQHPNHRLSLCLDVRIDQTPGRKSGRKSRFNVVENMNTIVIQNMNVNI